MSRNDHRASRTFARTSPRAIGVASLVAVGALATSLAGADDEQAASATAPAGVTTVAVPGTAVELELVDVRRGEGERPLLVMRREVTWNLFDVFVFELDKRKGNSTPESDAMTRPTKPYISVDRGFGHNGHPAISMSFENALRFADWVSVKTGHRFRIPTVAEWRELCAAAAPDAAAGAWHEGNADSRTHKVGERSADRLGCFDVLGNVAEWAVETAEDGARRGVVMGGSFRDPLDDLGCDRVQADTPDWNISDPQFPKSIWWLADADFVGMRLVCDGPIDATDASESENENEIEDPREGER